MSERCLTDDDGSQQGLAVEAERSVGGEEGGVWGGGGGWRDEKKERERVKERREKDLSVCFWSGGGSRCSGGASWSNG